MIELRIGELLDENSVTPEQLAKILNIYDKSVVYNWLRKDNMPSMENLIKIAEYFSCSLDYLVGRTEDYSEIKSKACVPFDEQLKLIMKMKNVSQYKMAKDKVVTLGHFYRWFNKKSIPTIETSIGLADYFNISLDFLFGRE